MEAGQHFGEYLLFKRLATDALGDTFRAGRVGEQGVDRVVMLRLFDGPAIDRQAFGPALANCAGLQSVLKSPHLGDGVDLAAEQGVPFVAYEYVSGKNLHHLQQQAREKPFPIPVEHALFIIERVALGLSAAYETRFRGEKLVHGFLTPSWVWLSSEGEIRLLGLDAAAALRTLPAEARQRPEFAPYLSPEVLAGGTPESADDVFSLGAILFELLTGATMPDDDREAAVEDAMLAAEGIQVPPGMRQLLARSIGPRDQRITSADKWRLALSTLISEGDYNPTTFNLAFFLHTLFRGDIERESEEIERETTNELLAPAGAASDALADDEATTEEGDEAPDALLAPVELADAETAKADTDTDTLEPYTPARSLAGVARATSDDGRRKKLLIGAGAAAVLLLALGAGAYYYFVMRDDGTGSVADAAASAVTAPPVVETALPAPVDEELPEALGDSGGDEAIDGQPPADELPEPDADIVAVDDAEAPPTPEELEARVAQLVARNVAGMEASLKAEYESRLSSLREQLDQAREEAAKAAEEEVATSPAAPAGSRQPPTTTPPPTSRPASPATPVATERSAEPQDAVQEPGAAPGSADRQEGAAEPAALPTRPADEPAAMPADEPAEMPVAEPADEEPADEPPAEPAAKKREPVKRGEIVAPGPGVVTPRIVRRALPVYPAPARKFAKTASVRLRVLVDEKGRASKIEQLSARAGFGFDEAAERAARATVWSEPTKDGVAVKMWIELTVEFQP